MNACLHSVSKPLKAWADHTHTRLAATCVVCRTGLRVRPSELSVVKVLTVGNWVSERGQINVGGLYHFFLLL